MPDGHMCLSPAPLLTSRIVGVPARNSNSPTMGP